ncbi:ATPase V1 complex subunit H [Pyrrhoderma noxium]|uniref:V-type proton ATPase subunit H n=1 Tax=Pyrrhoderma noxium TaxID=2282107 RepID=A0A286UXN8_9AGAM|nr:ATPase V1 complex subunit H [Pyrrhoderma noxium]
MSLSLVSNSYIEETSAKIRSKPVPWEAYQRAGLVTPDELALIKRVDRQPRSKTEALLSAEGQTYALLYLGLLNKLNRVDTMQWILVLITDALADHEERISLFTRAVEKDPELPYAALLKTLDNQDEFLQLKTAQILTVLLGSELSSIKPQHLKPFLETLASLTQSPSPHKRDVAVQCLESLLPRAEVRKAVWAHSKIIVGLRDILQNKPSAQMNYQVCFCFWLLTFEQEISENINKKYDIIPLLTDVAQAAVKEKVIRVIVATFRNLVTKAPSQNLPSMLVAQLLPFAKSLCTRKWTDEDIVEDVQFLRDELKANFDSLTTWEEYIAELESGHLSWSPVHESDTFWQENASKLGEKDNAQLKLLVKLLNESTDPVVLAVATHDLGQFVKYTERGKKIVSDLGAKTRVMQLMTHENADLFAVPLNLLSLTPK